MPIPDFQSAMLPTLQVLEDGKEHSVSEIRDIVAKHFKITPEEMEEMLPSGVQRIFYNRIAWSITHLKMADLIQSNKRSYYSITESGLNLLDKKINRIDLSTLRSIKAYADKRETWGSNSDDKILELDSIDNIKTPDELLESGYLKIRSELGQEILTNIKNCSPQFFEKLVLDVLIKLGYGGSDSSRATLLGKSGDDGVDGVINEDKLGLDVIYIQAKRWENQVGQPEIQKFAGALQGQRAKKGIFITTSSFSKPAIEYTEKIENRIILIDGKFLSDLMINHNVGVTTKKVFEIKRIDSDYFVEEE